MSYIRKWNRFFFERSLSIFDIFGMSIILHLAESNSWILLLFVPLIFCSLALEKTFTKDQNETSSMQ